MSLAQHTILFRIVISSEKKNSFRYAAGLEVYDKLGIRGLAFILWKKARNIAQGETDTNVELYSLYLTKKLENREKVK